MRTFAPALAQLGQARSDAAARLRAACPFRQTSRLSLRPCTDRGNPEQTGSAGYNQDLGVDVSGGTALGPDQEGWKESGGFAGTFSPNAAFVTTDLHLQAGKTYTVWLVWKANRHAPASSAIWAGAGPIGSSFSPTTLTALSL